MNKLDEYRGNAAECERMVRVSVDLREKAIWQEMVAHWLRMVESAEADTFSASVQRQSDVEH